MMKRREFTKVMGAGLGGASIASAYGAPTKRPNIIYMIVHDLGKHCTPYGVPIETPNLQRFSEEGVTFTNAFCASPPCSPSRACAMTGTYAHENGVVGLSHLGFGASDSFVHVTRHLRDAGYETVLAGLQHELHHHDAQQLLKYDKMLAHRGSELDIFVDNAVDDAIAYLENRGDLEKPFFLNIGTQETHMSMWGPDNVYQKKYNRIETYGGRDPKEKIYVPPQFPDNEATHKLMSYFQPCIRYMDQHFGRLMDAVKRLGLEENTLVVFTTDHGITGTRAKGTLYDHGMEITLLARWKGVTPPGRRANCLINNIDVFPTLLELAGAPVPGQTHGTSFLPKLTGGGYREHTMIFMERNYHNNYDPMRSVRTKKHHYILNLDPTARYYYTAPEIEKDPRPGFRKGWPNAQIWMVNSDDTSLKDWPLRPKEELYDIENDPNEFVNLADDPAYAEIKKRLAARCKTWMEETDDPLLKGDIPPSETMRKKMAEKGRNG